jgi:hypothetical protein
MATRKNNKFKKSNKRFRKTRSKNGGTKQKQKRKTNKAKKTHKTKKKHKAKKTKKEVEPELCAICLLDIKNVNDIPELDCNHKFHTDCLRQWCLTEGINLIKRCPLCKDDITSKCIQFMPVSQAAPGSQYDFTLSQFAPDSDSESIFIPSSPEGPPTPRPFLTMEDLRVDDRGPPLTMEDLRVDEPVVHSYSNYDEEEEIIRRGNVGDEVEYIPNNQLGYRKYKISLDENGEKYLEVIGDIYGPIGGGKTKKQRGGVFRVYGKKKRKLLHSNIDTLTEAEKVERKNLIEKLAKDGTKAQHTEVKQNLRAQQQIEYNKQQAEINKIKEETQTSKKEKEEAIKLFMKLELEKKGIKPDTNVVLPENKKRRSTYGENKYETPYRDIAERQALREFDVPVTQTDYEE